MCLMLKCVGLLVAKGNTSQLNKYSIRHCLQCQMLSIGNSHLCDYSGWFIRSS